MNIHEYQAKSVLAKYGVAVPTGFVAAKENEIADTVVKVKGPVWVVKAQIHAGGRGKGGGVKVCKSAEEATEAARSILGMTSGDPTDGSGRQRGSPGIRGGRVRYCPRTLSRHAH